MTSPAPAPRSDVLCSSWATPGDIPGDQRDTLSDSDWEPYLLYASEILWALSGRTWYGSGCTETATFRGACTCCGQRVEHPDGSLWYVPLRGEVWRPRHSRALKLPRDTVTGITTVTIDGAAFTEYWLDDRAGLLYRDDMCGWDVCDGPIEVTYTHGEPPPEGGVRGAVALAVQFQLADAGSGECVLPERVQNLTRQGISMTMIDPQEFLTEGRVGLYTVDLWLRAVNPLGRGERGRVWSPDVPRLRR